MAGARGPAGAGPCPLAPASWRWGGDGQGPQPLFSVEHSENTRARFPLGAPGGFRLLTTPWRWSQDPAEFDLGESPAKSQWTAGVLFARRHPRRGGQQRVFLWPGSRPRGFAQFRLYLSLQWPPPAPRGTGVAVRWAQPGQRGCARCPHLCQPSGSPACRPLSADVLRGVGFIPTRGARGHMDNFSLPRFSRPRCLASRGDNVTTWLVASSQGRAGSVPWLQGAGQRLRPWCGTPEPGWGGPGTIIIPLDTGVWEEALGSRFGWSPGHLIRCRRADSSPEPMCERMYGNPIATVVLELCKVHIVLRLLRCSACRGFLFHTPERLLEAPGHSPWLAWPSPPQPPGRYAALEGVVARDLIVVDSQDNTRMFFKK